MDTTFNPLRALLLPFDRGLLDLPSRAFLMRAEFLDDLIPWKGRLVCEQSFKPAFDRLGAAGFQAVRGLEGHYQAGLVRLTKHKGESRAMVARAWGLLEPGGLLVCAAANALGASGIEKEIGKTLGVEGSLSKHQSRVFWLRRGEGEMPDALRRWLDEGAPKPVADSRLVARAGCFSVDHVDKGSALLSACLPDTVAGRVADLGAGWGYLADTLLHRFLAVTQVDLYEAEDMALADARTNLARFGARATFHWTDVTAGLDGDVAPYDWIVSNPPFHDGGKADPGIGNAFITTAWKAIRRRGKFLLVANRHLPYEAELRRRFRSVELLREQDGFKVYLSTNRHDR